MARHETLRNLQSFIPFPAFIFCFLVMAGVAAAQGPVAQPPYKLSVFAKNAKGESLETR
jgi:hypothetical protein